MYSYNAFLKTLSHDPPPQIQHASKALTPVEGLSAFAHTSPGVPLSSAGHSHTGAKLTTGIAKLTTGTAIIVRFFKATALDIF